MFTIEMLPAQNGDALWIEYGNPNKPSRILIDGGISGTINNIETKILDIAKIEGVCKLELLVITHIDADHIEGIVKLLGKPRLPLEIEDIWFNGYRHLPEPTASPEDDEFLGPVQGEYLSALILERNLPWNNAFEGKTIFVPSRERGPLPKKKLPGGMHLTLVSPRFPELIKLSKKWNKVVKEAGLLEATHEEVLAALRKDRKLRYKEEEFLSGTDVNTLLEEKKRFDKSEANGGSIAFIASFDGKSCLFAGDAHSPVLQEGVTRAAQEAGVEKIKLDAHKVAHHGSKKNIHSDMLGSMICHRLLVSTNGSRFKHPDAEAIAQMVGGEWRGNDPKKDELLEICFNYLSDFNKQWDNKAMETKWNYKARYSPFGKKGGLLITL